MITFNWANVHQVLPRAQHYARNTEHKDKMKCTLLSAHYPVKVEVVNNEAKKKK